MERERPTRWLDDPGAPAALKEFARAASPPPPLDAVVIDRVARALSSGTGATSTPAARTPALSTLAALVIAVTAALWTWHAAREPSESARETVSTSESSESTSAPVVAPAPRVEEPPVSPAPAPRAVGRSSRPARTEPVPPTTATGIGGEAALLDRARGLLASDPVQALALTDEHRHTFAHGHLEPEREVVAVDALLRLHRRAEAEARASALRASFPGGLYARRLDGLLTRASTLE